MRIGNNPMKGKYAPARLKNIVLHVNTYLPNLEGYHAQRLEVVKACIRSMIKGVQLEHSIIISDCGSVPELVEWIRDEVKPNIFNLCDNFGKNNQRKMIASMLPPETILCYADDDIMFTDNWLRPQIDLLLNFPNVACVSGYPVRTSFRWGNTNTKLWALDNAIMSTGRFIPDEWERDFCNSIGRDYETHDTSTRGEVDTVIDYNGRRAFATSHHCQQIGYAGIINKALMFDNEALGSERDFDIRLDKLGLRLATTDRLARHIGNVLDKEVTK
jgi:glycosyltransferase involved in cell wall biosynthesis